MGMLGKGKKKRHESQSAFVKYSIRAKHTPLFLSDQ